VAHRSNIAVTGAVDGDGAGAVAQIGSTPVLRIVWTLSHLSVKSTYAFQLKLPCTDLVPETQLECCSMCCTCNHAVNTQMQPVHQQAQEALFDNQIVVWPSSRLACLVTLGQ